MKIFAASVLVLLLALPAGAAEDSAVPDDVSTILTSSENIRASELESTAPVASALDLSLFGIISLGVLGLFWIRRHTSEL